MKNMWHMLVNDPAAVRKFLIALIGAVVVAVSVGLLPAVVGDYVTVVVAFLTALGVYATPNERTNPDA